MTYSFVRTEGEKAVFPLKGLGPEGDKLDFLPEDLTKCMLLKKLMISSLLYLGIFNINFENYFKLFNKLVNY